MHFSIIVREGWTQVSISVSSQSLISYHQISNGVIRITESHQGQKGGCFHNLCRNYGRQQKEQEMERNELKQQMSDYRRKIKKKKLEEEEGMIAMICGHGTNMETPTAGSAHADR